ncbi:DUF4190 domain-containing protein [Brachybacterium sp. YJGR34]|uniref:DUF4190 domain-containing protein n=1 Tax=Brachybacterium sp. YJGR34 TaxID=2059911 RepID=UPI000E0A4B8E|nr:DUF4190 domain-containing protein [Brachybacterium sp. YJGR34]
MNYQNPAPFVDKDALRTNAIILTVVGFLCGGTIPAIFGIIALVQLDTNPASAQSMAKVGWIIFWVLLAVGILFAVLWLLLFGGMMALPFLVNP